MSDIKLTDEQEAIIDNPDTQADTLVIAGAGSGKTFTMTRRIIHLIQQGARPEEILGLTFTNKAAGELNQRVLAAFQGTRQGADAALSAHPQVSTYDSFFQSLVRRYGVLIGVDPTVQPLTHAGRVQLASRVVSRHLSDLFAASQATDELFKRIGLEGVSFADDTDPSAVPSFSELVDKVLNLENECLSYMIDTKRTTVTAAVVSARRWNDAFIRKCRGLLEQAFSDFPDDFRRMLEHGEKGGTPRSGKKESKEEGKCRQLEFYRVYRLYLAAERRDRIMDLAVEYDAEKARGHMAEFSDFPAFALRLLTRFPSIGEEYRARYRYVFLDEYQDTSTTQAVLLSLLFHAGKDKRSAVTAVGDPFQSIYGWRGASPSAFKLFTRDFGIHAESIRTLSATVRNKPMVLSVANRLTNPLRAPARLHRVSATYKDDAFRDDTPVKELTVLGEKDRGPQEEANVSVLVAGSRPQEEDAIAAFAKWEIGRYRASRNAEGGKGRTEASGPVVAVLLRSATHFGEYRRAMEAAGLRCEVVGQTNPLDAPEARDLLAVLESVVDPGDSRTVMRLLASPRYGLTASDLAALSSLATRINEEQWYQQLVVAGIATGTEDAAQRAALVRANRDSLPMASGLTDLLLSEGLAQELDDPDVRAQLSLGARRSILDVSRILRDAESHSDESVPSCLRAAVSALGLDADLPVAAAVRQTLAEGRFSGQGGEGGVAPARVPSRSEVSASLDAFLRLADSYAGEMPEGMAPTLSGFVSWVRSLGPDDVRGIVADTQPDADVVIMTVHQAKGLEWPAVVVAGMDGSVFPSSNSVRFPLPTSGSGDAKAQAKEEFQEARHDFVTAASVWAVDDASVPYPVRSDASVLPAFPHGAVTGEGADPLADIEDLGSLEELYQEVFAPRPEDIGTPDSPTTRSTGVPAFLSLEERCGERAAADELRIAYVALTRSRGDLLVTCTAKPAPLTPGSMSTPVGEAASSLRKDAGLFWQSIHNQTRGAAQEMGQPVREPCVALALQGAERSGAKTVGEDTVRSRQGTQAGAGMAQAGGPGAARSADDRMAATPAARLSDEDCAEFSGSPLVELSGLCAGPDASDLAAIFETAVPYETRVEIEQRDPQAAGQALWPARLTPSVETVLSDAAESVLRAIASSTPERRSGAAGPRAVEGQLTRRAKELLELRGYSQAGSRSGSDLPQGQDSRPESLPQSEGAGAGRDWTRSTASIARAASEAMAGKSIPVTRLQRIVTASSEEEERQALVEIIRPMPQPPKDAANLGTMFHAWVASRLDPAAGEPGPSAAAGDSQQAGISTGSSASSSTADLQVLERLARIESNPDDPLARRIATWKRAFEESIWSRRQVESVEQEYELYLSGHRLPARLDAVFRGAISDEPGHETPGRFTVVDWKTGRRPQTASETRARLLQLRVYRIAFALSQGIDPGDVDAALFYVSQADPGRRQIELRDHGTLEDLMAQLDRNPRFVRFMRSPQAQE